MPQVFGADELGLVSTASLWVEAATTSPRFHDFVEQEGFGRDAPFNEEQIALSKHRTPYVRELGVKTLGNKPPRKDANDQLLNGDGYHEFVVHHDQRIDEGAPDNGKAGPRKYELSYHHVDKNGKLHAQSLWMGNDFRGLDRAHEQFKAAMGRVR